MPAELDLRRQTWPGLEPVTVFHFLV